jgi:hypothetical protein
LRQITPFYAQLQIKKVKELAPNYTLRKFKFLFFILKIYAELRLIARRNTANCTLKKPSLRNPAQSKKITRFCAKKEISRVSNTCVYPQNKWYLFESKLNK